MAMKNYIMFVLVIPFPFICFQVNKTSDGLAKSVQEIERNLSNVRKTMETKNAEVTVTSDNL